MSDPLENMANMQGEIEQPTDVVATEVEEGGQPQAADGEIELYIETEGDQQTTPNDSDAELHARWLKERDKRKRKNEELQREREERERIQRELDELKNTVGSLTKGPKPTLESCDYDEDLFEQKLKEYLATPGKSQTEQRQPEQVSQPVQTDDQAEFYLYQKEAEIEKQLPNYAQEKSQLLEKMKQYGGNEATINFMAGLAKYAGIDIAKANVAFNRVPGLLDELNSAFATQNQFAVAEVMKKAESKVQLRQRKPISTQPEPTINSSGPIDNKSAAVARARDAWMNAKPEDQAQLWQEYQRAKKS